MSLDLTSLVRSVEALRRSVDEAAKAMRRWIEVNVGLEMVDGVTRSRLRLIRPACVRCA